MRFYKNSFSEVTKVTQYQFCHLRLCLCQNCIRSGTKKAVPIERKIVYPKQKKSQGRSPCGVLCILDFFSVLENLLISGTAFFYRLGNCCSHASDFRNSFMTTVPLSHKHRNQFSFCSDAYRSKSAYEIIL